MINSKKIAVIIPTFNEEKNISKLITSIRKSLLKSLIYVVDDSKNLKIQKILKGKKNIKYIHRINKSGRGSAVIDGLKIATKKKNITTFIEMDADFSHDPKEILRNLKFFKDKKLDLLIASRYMKKSKIVNWNINRKILSRLSNILAKFLLRIKVTDYTNGFRFYSVRSAKKIIKDCGRIGDGFIVLSEILMVINSNNFKIDEIESVFVNRNRGESTVNLKLVIYSFLGLLKLFLIKIKRNVL